MMRMGCGEGGWMRGKGMDEREGDSWSGWLEGEVELTSGIGAASDGEETPGRQRHDHDEV
jgi:hypothetical protein